MSATYTRAIRRFVASVVVVAFAVIGSVATTVVDAPPAAAATWKPFQCLPHYEYAVSSSGEITQIAPDGTTSSMGSWKASFANGLGITASGDRAYSYDRSWGNGGNNKARILTYDARGQTFTTTSDSYIAAFAGDLIGGALDLDTGDFYFGGFEKADHAGVQEYRFRIFEYAPNAHSFSDRGFAWTGITDSGQPNGDIAFDADGNLYIVRGSWEATNLIIVSAASLAASTGGEVPASTSKTIAGGLPGTNGLDFDNLGNAYLSNWTTVARFDPTTWTKLDTVTTSLPSNTDLGSCLAPPTMTGTVSVDARNAPSDQFTLSIRSGTVTSMTNSTTGSATGVQPAVVGPLPVLAESTYDVVQDPAGTTDPNDYRTTWSCRSASGVISSGSGSTAMATIPTNPAAPDRGVRVSCAFVNVLKPKLTLVKAFDIRHDAPADASTWQLSATAGTTSLAFTSGQTRVVEPTTYTLAETAQPGYVLEAVSCADASGTTVAVGSSSTVAIADGQRVTCTLTNADQPGSVTWRKTDEVSGKVVGGATFTLTAPSGTSVDVGDNTGQTGYSGADTDARPGVFRVTGLSWGTYTLTEKSPPDGYHLATASTSFTIGASRLDVTTADVTDERILTFDIEKHSYSDRGQTAPALLDGAAFDLRADDHGHPGAAVSGVLQTGAQPGRFALVDIAPGSYWLVETAAPSGYAPLVAPIAFAVRHDAAHPDGAIDLGSTTDPLVSYDTASRTLRIWDARVVALPSAGGPGTIAFTSAGVALMASAALLWVRARRRRGAASASESSPPTPTSIDTQKAEGL